MRTGQAQAIMSDFAKRTGLTCDVEANRYLWTDAFALYNLLELYLDTGEDGHAALATKLIEQVHGVLGRHRADDPRKGWLSGLSEAEGARHPTRGGLRIGKPLPERRPGERLDERLEWERDGQYFHYLTKWMDALSRAATVLGEAYYHAHAVELAKSVFPHFLQNSPSGRPTGLAWKMSIDLSRPQVSGTSPHDALDGYVTFRRLSDIGSFPPTAGLEEETNVLYGLSAEREWDTSDPLGVGGLLLDAFRLSILTDVRSADEQLIRKILEGADLGLQHFLRGSSLQAGPSRRLAFRELGLAIGLQTLPATKAAAERCPSLAQMVAHHLQSLLSAADIERRIVEFWSDPQIRDHPTWQDHRDINEVMLATAMIQAQVRTTRLSRS